MADQGERQVRTAISQVRSCPSPSSDLYSWILTCGSGNSGRLRVGNSPSSASPTLRVSASQTPPPPIHTSPVPSHASLSTPSRSTFTSTAATSLYRPSPRRSEWLGDKLQPTTTASTPSFMERRLSSSSSNSAPSRPRLSAEYSPHPPTQDRTARRRKSIISLIEARSESGAGQGQTANEYLSDDGQGDQGRGETRSEGGGRAIGRERDVRRQHEALRRRLREAASNAASL